MFFAGYLAHISPCQIQQFHSKLESSYPRPLLKFPDKIHGDPIADFAVLVIKLTYERQSALEGISPFATTSHQVLSDQKGGERAMHLISVEG